MLIMSAAPGLRRYAGREGQGRGLGLPNEFVSQYIYYVFNHYMILVVYLLVMFYHLISLLVLHLLVYIIVHISCVLLYIYVITYVINYEFNYS